jgi:aspartyl-tRNA synthetase
MPPHGGSSTGLERITMKMLNLPNVKEATLFPRDINRIDTLLSKTQDTVTVRDEANIEIIDLDESKE